MLSRISKMSVLGIAALMLVLGLAADDAFAQAAGTNEIEMAATPDPLRAAGTATRITFTVRVAGRESLTNPDRKTPAGTVRIRIPSEWPTNAVAADVGTDISAGTDVSAGEVTFDKDGTVNFNQGTDPGRHTGYISGGRVLVVNLAAGADGNGTYTVHYGAATAPYRRGEYRFPVTGATYADIDGSDGVGEYVTVDWAADGSGTVSIAPFTPQKDVKIGDDVHPYNDEYVVVSKQSLSALSFTYTAAGSMPKGSTFSIVMAGFSLADKPNNDSTASVSGHGSPKIARTADTVTATVDAAAGLVRGNTITIRIKVLEAPTVEGTTAADTDNTFTANSASGTTAADDTITAGTSAPIDKGLFTFVTTSKHGTGSLTLTSSVTTLGDAGNLTNMEVQEGTDIGTLTLAVGGNEGVGPDSKYQIHLPTAFPAPVKSIPGIGQTTVADPPAGETNAPEIDAGNKILKGSLTDAADPYAPTSAISVTYLVKAVPGQGRHTFGLKTNSGPHGSLTDVGGDGYPRWIDVTAKHDSGDFVVMEGNRALVQSTPKAVHTLRLVYTAKGYMPKGTVIFQLPDSTPPWPAFRSDNGDGTADAGEVTFSGKANFAINDDRTITATHTSAWQNGDQIVVTYKNATVPDTPNPVPYTFTARVAAFGTAPTDANESHIIGPGRAGDGSGSIAITPDRVNANTEMDFVLTYTAEGTMAVGAVVEVTKPTAWPAFTADGTTVSIGTGGAAASLTTTADKLTATAVESLGKDAKIVFNINGVTTPNVGGSHTFTAASRAHPSSGGLQPLSSGAPVNIAQVADGMVMLSSMSAEPGADVGDLMIVFTAGAAMESGSVVTIDIPAAFPSVRSDNNDGVNDEGEVVLKDGDPATLDVSGGGATPWKLTLTTNAAIPNGGTLTVTYREIDAPETEGVYTFTSMASIVAGEGLLPLVGGHPTFTVRKAVTAIAVVTDPDPAVVFTGDSITVTVSLWAGAEAGKALGDQVVTLSDGDAGGTFSPASITIADNAHDGSATYTSSTAGTATLTATLGDMDPVSVDATIKSKIRDESVSKTVVSQGDSITVSAIGEAGNGSVTIRDADGEKVGLTRALDPIGEPDADGDQQYERSLTLPDPLADGMYTVNIAINDDSVALEIQVLNDPSVPMLTDANVLPSTVMNGDVITLTVKATSPSMSNPIASVMADVSAVDSTQTDMVMLSMQMGTDNTYVAVHTISMDNTAADGMVDVTFTATNQIGGEGTAMASVTLANDPSTLDSVNVPSDTFRPGDMVTITAMGTAGQMVKFTVTSSDGTEMPSDMAMTEEPADSGMYMGTFEVVADVHGEGMYDVTVTMNDNPAKSMTMEDALDIGPAGYMFTLSIPKGTHIIHIPLDVNTINGEEGTIETVGDVYDALGDAVNYIITVGDDGGWMTYLGEMSEGTTADAAIGDDTGLVVVMDEAKTLALVGDALGTAGVSQINILPGNNLVGVPLDPAVDMMISAALVEGVASISISNEAGNGFHTIRAAGDMGDGPVMGGVGYLVAYTGAEATSIPVPGSAWENDGDMMAAPAVAFDGSQTPVLYVEGGVMDEFDMLAQIPELHVTVKNLSTGASLDTVLGTELSETAYSGTFVELSRHAAKIGDVIEIVAHTANPYVGVRPVPQIVVSADEVLNSRISLPDLELYEIPSETELLANYPNPFNPETWIPYRLAKAAEVTLAIYDTNGALVRSIDVGFKPAAVYESRASAIYWDGRNNYGERVASGTYFYHLTAGDDYASTRRMVILK